MLCDVCKKNEATIHIQEVVNNNIRSVHLCDECAKTYGIKSNLMDIGFSIIDLFDNFNENIEPIEKDDSKQIGLVNKKDLRNTAVPSCPVCGTTLLEFIESAKFGCGNCYLTFKDYVKPLLRKIHSKAVHKGKVPGNMRHYVKISNNLRKLNNDLKIAVKNENYEYAAVIRDRIKELKNSVDKSNEIF